MEVLFDLLTYLNFQYSQVDAIMRSWQNTPISLDDQMHLRCTQILYQAISQPLLECYFAR